MRGFRRRVRAAGRVVDIAVGGGAEVEHHAGAGHLAAEVELDGLPAAVAQVRLGEILAGRDDGHRRVRADLVRARLLGGRDPDLDGFTVPAATAAPPGQDAHPCADRAEGRLGRPPREHARGPPLGAAQQEASRALHLRWLTPSHPMHEMMGFRVAEPTVRPYASECSHGMKGRTSMGPSPSPSASDSATSWAARALMARARSMASRAASRSPTPA